MQQMLKRKINRDTQRSSSLTALNYCRNERTNVNMQSIRRMEFLLSYLEETCKPKPKHETLDVCVSCKSQHTIQARQQAFPEWFLEHPEIYEGDEIINHFMIQKKYINK